MVVRRRRGTRKVPKRKPGQSMAGEALMLAQAAVKGVAFIKGIINSELHKTDVLTTAAISTTPLITLVNSISQGDDVADRQGNSILCKTIEIDYLHQQNLSATISDMRIVFVMDTANQGVTPAWTDVFTSATNGTQSLRNVDNVKRFKILSDRHYKFSSSGVRSYSGKFFLKINKHLYYSSGTNTAVLQNAIYRMAYATEPTNTVGDASSFRTSFYDN